MSNESVHECFGMCYAGEGKCGGGGGGEVIDCKVISSHGANGGD